MPRVLLSMGGPDSLAVWVAESDRRPLAEQGNGESPFAIRR